MASNHALARQQAASHGNDDAKKRLDALAKVNPELLNRNDHDQHVDTKLVRKRTAAKIRSDEQRERIAASKLAASLAGPDLTAPPPAQHHQGPPLQQHAQPQATYDPGRQSVASVASGGSAATLRRKNTQRQVEAAARMGQHLSTGLNGRATPSMPQNGQVAPGGFVNGSPQGPPGATNRQSYRLSDAPPSNLPITQRPQPPASMRPIQEINVAPIQPQRAQPSSFAEMVSFDSESRAVPGFRLTRFVLSVLHIGHRHDESEKRRLRHHVESNRFFYFSYPYLLVLLATNVVGTCSFDSLRSRH